MYSPKCPDRYCHCFKWYSVFNDGGEQSLIFHEVCSTCFDLDNLFPVCWVNKLPIIIALPSPILELALKKWHNSHLLWWCFTTFQRPECDLKGWYIFSMQLQCSAVRSCWISSKAFIYWGFHLVKQNKSWLPAMLCDSTSDPSRGLVEKWVEQMEICQSCPFKVTLTWDLTFYHICKLLRLHTDQNNYSFRLLTTEQLQLGLISLLKGHTDSIC